MTALLDRILPRPYRAALADDFTLRDNPIFIREARRDSRRRDHFIFTLVALGLLWGVLAGAAAIIHIGEVRGWLRHGIPPALGGSYGGLFLVLFSGIHYWLVYHAAWRRSSLFFLQEYRQN